MCIKATVVAYAFSVQCFENATIVAYTDLGIKAYNWKVVLHFAQDIFSRITATFCNFAY